MADREHAIVVVPPSDDDCLGKLSMTTMDGERGSSTHTLKQPYQASPRLDNQAEHDSQSAHDDEAVGDSNQVTDDFVVVEQAAVPSASAVADPEELEELPVEFATASASTAARAAATAITIESSSAASATAEELVIESSATTATTNTSTTITETEQASEASIGDEHEQDEQEEDEHVALDRRMTYIGEGLLDVGGMDAIDRLSDVSGPYSNIEHLVAGAAADTQERADVVRGMSIDEEGVQPPIPAAQLVESNASVESPPPTVTVAPINRLQAFLSMGSAQKPVQRASPLTVPTAVSAAQAPVRAFPPPLPPQAPTAAPVAQLEVKTIAIENRRSKLLDFLANDVGERYLDGVYQEETRDEPDVSSDESGGADDSSRPEKNDAELEQERQRRAQRANSKLLAFLAKERGERLHRGERDSDEEKSQHSSLASEALPARPTVLSTPPTSQSSVSSNSQHEPQLQRAQPKTPSKLLEFVAKVVPDKPKLVIFNPEDAVSETEELEHLVAEEAQKKKQKREERERARQKVLAFLAEEDASSGTAHARVAMSTVKSVDETKVQREKVVDRYGREGLLDFLDRTEAAQQQRIKWATSRGSSHGSASPVSSASNSPKSLLSPGLPTSPSATAQTVPSQEKMPVPPVSSVPAPAASLSRTPSSTGNRLASFLSKITSKHVSSSSSSGSPSSSPEKTKLSAASSNVPPCHAPQQRAPTAAANAVAKPVAVPTSVDISAAPAATPTPTAETNGTRAPSSKMLPVLAVLEQISQTCASNELSDVSVARITTLLTSISQIVKDDVQRGGKPPVRRWSNASVSASAASPSGAASPSWIKSGKDIEEFDRKHALVKSASTPPTPVKSDMPAVLERDSELKVTVASGVLESFGEFENAQNLLEIVAAFHQLLADCGLTDLKLEQPWSVYDHVKAAVVSKLSFRQKQLFKLLDAKLSGDAYASKPAARKRVCIIGAGPVGLRAAVEMALLGAQVVVLEKRKHFSRENILHLWPWVVQDLTSLGAKVLFPQFCHSTAYFHVGTRQLQCILLKVALLLGVTFFPATAFDSIAHPDSVESDRRPFYTVVTKPQIPWMEFTAVLGASGTQDRLSEQARIKRFVFSRKEAIGLVCYFPNHNSTEEKNIAEFSWTIQFKQQMFAKMRDIGVDLENIVYYRGEMHYLVMTPKRQNLLDQGVMKHDYPNVSDLVLDDNIDKPVLHEYLKRVVEFVKIPQKSDFARVRIFDFSARTRADKAASILTSKGKKLYVGLIGDSLMEPFWPEGLGTCRGFLSALDGCWMVARIGFSSDEQLLADRELAYRIIQHVSGFRRDDLQKNVRKYSVDPTTRYTVKFPQLC